MARIGRTTFVASQVYLGLLAAGALLAAFWMVRFWQARIGYLEALARAPDEGLKVMLVVYAPLGLALGAIAALVLAVLLRRPRSWALAVSVLSAPAALAVTYLAHRVLLAAERGYHDRSRYVELYRQGAYPLIALTAAYFAVLALDLLVLAPRRARAAALDR